MYFFGLNEIYFMRLMTYIMQFYNMLWHHTRHSTVNKATFYIFCIKSEKRISTFTHDNIKLIILPSLTTSDSMISTKLSNKLAGINRPYSVTVAGLDKSCIYVVIYDMNKLLFTIISLDRKMRENSEQTVCGVYMSGGVSHLLTLFSLVSPSWWKTFKSTVHEVPVPDGKALCE